MGCAGRTRFLLGFAGLLLGSFVGLPAGAVECAEPTEIGKRWMVFGGEASVVQTENGYAVAWTVRSTEPPNRVPVCRGRWDLGQSAIYFAQVDGEGHLLDDPVRLSHPEFLADLPSLAWNSST